MATGNPVGYVLGDNTQHVVYRGRDNHIHELWWDGAWHHNDLTNAAGAPAASSSPEGYILGDGTQHVVYRGGDDHIHELWWDGTWHHNDLSVAAP
jgi:carbohydrate-selective porin OprB